MSEILQFSNCNHPYIAEKLKDNNYDQLCMHAEFLGF